MAQVDILASPPTASEEQDSLYFFQDIYFMVEKTLFKVPRHHFEQESAIFRDMFSLPTAMYLIADGSSEWNPLCLDGIDKDDFRQLLRVLYPRHFDREELSVSQWSSVLKLAIMWEFENIRKLAIDKLTAMTMDGVTKIALAKEHNIQEWWFSALCAIAEKAERIKEDDVGRIGVALSLRIAEFQGRVFGYSRHSSSGSTTLEKCHMDGVYASSRLQQDIQNLFPECIIPPSALVKVSRGCSSGGTRRVRTPPRHRE